MLGRYASDTTSKRALPNPHHFSEHLLAQALQSHTPVAC
jgi:hypothetical protein